MKNIDAIHVSFNNILLRLSFVAVFPFVASCCLSWHSPLYDRPFSEQINKGYMQTKRWLALRVEDNIVLICHNEDIKKWAISQQKGRWKVISTEEKPPQNTIETALSKQQSILADLLDNISNSKKAFAMHGDWAIIQAENVWKSLPTCTIIGYGNNRFVFWEFVDKPNSSDQYAMLSSMLHINFVVLAEEETFSELLVALKNRGEEVIMNQTNINK